MKFGYRMEKLKNSGSGYLRETGYHEGIVTLAEIFISSLKKGFISSWQSLNYQEPQNFIEIHNR